MTSHEYMYDNMKQTGQELFCMCLGAAFQGVNVAASIYKHILQYTVKSG